MTNYEIWGKENMLPKTVCPSNRARKLHLQNKYVADHSPNLKEEKLASFFTGMERYWSFLGKF